MCEPHLQEMWVTTVIHSFKFKMDSLQHIEDFQISRFQQKLQRPLLVSNDLELRTLSESIHHSEVPLKATNSEDALPFSEDETKPLHQHIKQLKDEIVQKDKTILVMKKKLDEFKLIMTDNGISGSATQKIVELSRKNRDFHSELAKEKTRVQKLQNQLSTLLAENISQQQKVMPSADSEQLLKDRVSSLEEQLLGARRKVAEQSNLCQRLKQDLRLAQKVLVQEVGEGVTINSLSKSNGWKGRAQQILTLQNKVSELQQQVACKDSRVSTVTRQQLILDDKHKASVHKIEKENKQRYQDLKGELERLQVDYESLQQQCSALKARNKTLTQECRELKKQVKQMPDREDHPPYELSCENLKKKIGILQSKLRNSEEETKKLKEAFIKVEKEAKTTSKCQNSSSVNEGGGVGLPPIKIQPGKQAQATRCSVSAGAALMQRKFLGLECEEIYAKYRVTEIERDKLLGLTELLQKRLDEADDKINGLQSDFNSLRLETKGKEIVKNKPGMSAESLHESLSLQIDENRVLRETLLMTRQQRQDDKRQFHSQLEQTRQIFSETLEAIKRSGDRAIS